VEEGIMEVLDVEQGRSGGRNGAGRGRSRDNAAMEVQARR